MNLRTLKRFICVVELGSINKAALHLNVSQPSLSKDLHDMEEILGVDLFSRSSKGVKLTPVGESIFVRAKLVSSEVGRIEGEARALREGSMGEVSVGVVPGFLQRQILPTATLNLIQEGRRLTVNYRFGHRSSLMEPLLRGDLDFLVVGFEDDVYNSELVIEPLVADRNALVVRSSHPIVANPGWRSEMRAASMYAALAQYPWLVLSDCIPMENLLRQMLRTRGIDSNNSIIRSDSFHFFRTALLASDCIGLTRYDSARLEHEAGHLVELPLTTVKSLHLQGSHMIGIVYRKEHALSPASEVLIKEIRSLIKAAGIASP